jgi:hypothetical protein
MHVSLREGAQRQPRTGVALQACLRQAGAWSEEATAGSHRSPATAGHDKSGPSPGSEAGGGRRGL